MIALYKRSGIHLVMPYRLKRSKMKIILIHIFVLKGNLMTYVQGILKKYPGGRHTSTMIKKISNGGLWFHEWVKGLWNSSLTMTGTLCTIPRLKGKVQYPKQMRTKNLCNGRVFSYLSSHGQLHYIDKDCVSLWISNGPPGNHALRERLIKTTDFAVTEKVVLECRKKRKGQSMYPAPVVYPRNYLAHLQYNATTSRSGIQGPSVNLIIIDSTSRFSFMKQMTKTVQFLESLQKNENVEVFQFFKYNIVGPGTTLNVPQMCGGCASSVKLRHCSPKWFTDYAKANKYITGFASETGTGTCGGHYDHSLSITEDFAKLIEDPSSKYLVYNGEVGFHKLGGYKKLSPLPFELASDNMQSHCLGGIYPSSTVLKYAAEFHRKYAGNARLLVSHLLTNHVTHQSGLPILDSDLAEYLSGGSRFESLLPLGLKNNFFERKLSFLEDTFTFIVGDHGLHYGDYVKTSFGNMEFKLPVFILIAPKKHLTDAQTAALRENEQRLVTAHDIYKTIQGIIASGSGANVPDYDGVGIPLTDFIPGNRTCDDAGIPTDICSCSHWKKASIPKQVERILIKAVMQKISILAGKGSEKFCIPISRIDFFSAGVEELDVFRRPTPLQIKRREHFKAAYSCVLRITLKASNLHSSESEVLEWLATMEMSGQCKSLQYNTLQVISVKRRSMFSHEKCSAENWVSKKAANGYYAEQEYCVCKEGNSL
mmetsp:Transcript_47488/g.152145  ORF Transcript_47488/g.152145 Transcript_47488/m.152145 type:complete len:709 (+) Transcript_47488:748-2874(+)